jgi:hypothetical protein
MFLLLYVCAKLMMEKENSNGLRSPELQQGAVLRSVGRYTTKVDLKH